VAAVPGAAAAVLEFPHHRDLLRVEAAARDRELGLPAQLVQPQQRQQQGPTSSESFLARS
jgi:hypothetical protein